jgi:hypothetical protein
MGFFDKIKSFFAPKDTMPPEKKTDIETGMKQVANNAPQENDIERIAAHEAAHGVIWYLFKQYWKVNQLTIERSNLPDDRMNGALHISPNFEEKDNNIARVNELFAIALAGVIGQNLRIVYENPNLILAFNKASLEEILDTRGCGGDFEIAIEYLSPLAAQYNIDKASFTKYKIWDLISIFQEHPKVQQVHARLFKILYDKKTLTRDELIEFFDKEKFQDYIDEEDLSHCFFHHS